MRAGGLLALPLHPGYQKASALGAPFTCSFEGTMCGWEDISNTAYRWDPAQASISTELQLPFDHTLGTDLGERFCLGGPGTGAGNLCEALPKRVGGVLAWEAWS